MLWLSGTRSQEFILPQVHSLDDVPTVVKYPADIFRVNSARKMRVTVMTSVSAGCADPLLRKPQENGSNEMMTYNSTGSN